MANMNRMSMYSTTSSAQGGSRNIVSAAQQSTQVSTTTLLNAIHTIYTSGQPYRLDASTSLIVNTWLTASQVDHEGRTGGTVDSALAARAWEHARRRAEDGCIVLGSLHPSTPSVLVPFLGTLPLSIPSRLYTALEAIRPFIHAVSPQNPSTPRQSALGVTLTLTLAGNLSAASLALSEGGIDTNRGLLNIPSETGYRAFDVFYYLLTSASTPAEREFLGLKHASNYALLTKSGTYDPPSYLPTADDAAAADDFRAALKEIGIKGAAHRNLISILAGLLKLGDTLNFALDEEGLEDVCEDVGGLLGLDPDVLVKQCTTAERETLIGGLYEALVDWVILKANEAISGEMQRIKDGDSSSDGGPGARTPNTEEDNGDTVCITILEIPDATLGKAAAMRGVFDDTQGINSEMKEDGVDVVAAGSSVLREMQNAVSEVGPDLGIMTGPAGRDREHELERREVVLEKVGREGEEEGFLKKILFPIEGQGVNLGREGRLDLPAVLGSSRVWYHLALHPTDESPSSLAALPSTTSAWSAGTVSRQLRAWRLPEWANRRNKNLDFTADFDLDEFCQRYALLGCKDGRDGIESWILERGWSNGEVVVGTERIWMREGAWWEAEGMLDLKPADQGGFMSGTNSMMANQMPLETGYSTGPSGSGFFPPMNELTPHGSREGLLARQSNATVPRSNLARSIAPSRNISGGDYGLGFKGDDMKGQVYYANENGELVNNMDPELAEPKSVTTTESTPSRRIWVGIVWALTFWIPSFVLRFVGRMKRPDVRMAWREKLVLVAAILFANGLIVFWIIGFGNLLCPNKDKVWDVNQLSTHQGDNDFWVGIHGKVYDISKFWKTQHSDTVIKTSSSNMQQFAGQVLDGYFVPPLTVACPGIVKDNTLVLLPNNTLADSSAIHNAGGLYPYTTSKLHSIDWYGSRFLPAIKEYYHGDIVHKTSSVQSDGQNNQHYWFILYNKVYDLTDYFYTADLKGNLAAYTFLDDTITKMIQGNAGLDITKKWEENFATSNDTQQVVIQNTFNCFQNAFYVGYPDFRDTPKCQVNNWILLAFTVIICCVILTKFLAALQFGSKRRPQPQDKFVICQVPAYTEGEDSLRKALDSLTALQYDNKRKLICVICDGMIVGGGNDRPTPKIVLDILGVDPKLDPPALPFKSVGESSEQLNYGKVYSGLYEYEGNVVPYIVVVKVGKESEQSKSKPGNRGKRDSQILLMSFLNRVHHRAPMSPLELEMFHQINNIIGVDPELYEYLLMVDADTSVREDSLNRLVAACANNAKIAGICGETSLENEERSWWTMIQVYEYYISHHLAKAFESLFGSVTCLPGCFSMYRLRTADKGKPLIISDKVIHEYADCCVDTLHKKNLLSLGEDRYLTTLMTKHFPYMSYKFIPDAFASTAAPETWSVLLSQRRRWINSTIHNLAELVWLKEMCGFCCFSMRFVVMIDLTGTIILPATTVYLGYLIYLVASHKGQFPLISIVLIAAVYGLQALIFILKRQWQHIGWMIIYILAFPIYSFVLPVYSFWNQDNFSWGNTRIVVEEKGGKQIVQIDDEGFDPRSIPLQRWDDYALSNNLPGRRGVAVEKSYDNYEDQYEMDDMKSMYSSVKPASTIMTGLQGRNAHYAPPISPGYNGLRQSVYSTGPYADQPVPRNQSAMSLGGGLQDRSASPYQDYPPQAHSQRPSMAMMPSSESNILGGMGSPSPMPTSQSAIGFRGGSRTPLGFQEGNRPVSQFDFQRGNAGPDDTMIVDAIQACLREVDLDTVTKKQVRALVEQRLQTELVGDRRIFLDRMIDSELANM
ncbi:chitin synthase-domain-containing protein [Amylocarpus encephaloides]|uniref:chitin synthase n=1 Tax=Amylocarpus encephaloides TaxID=45428 RepID=A0A9P7YED3_9HELO|nr:chitin synthase-domain-containing protein [Amylocarpus encephaloides]